MERLCSVYVFAKDNFNCEMAKGLHRLFAEAEKHGFWFCPADKLSLYNELKSMNWFGSSAGFKAEWLEENYVCHIFSGPVHGSFKLSFYYEFLGC